MPHHHVAHTCQAATSAQTIDKTMSGRGVSANIPNPPGRHPYGFGHRPVSVLEGHGNLSTVHLGGDIAQEANKQPIFYFECVAEQMCQRSADACRRAPQCFGFCEVGSIHVPNMEEPNATFSPSTHPDQFTSEEAA